MSAPRTIFKGLVKGLEDLEIRDHPDYRILKISLNTEKRPGDISHSASSEKPSANAGEKILKEVK